MREAIQRIKRVLPDKENPLAPMYELIRVSDGYMHATDGNLFIAVPVSSPFNFTAPGKDLVRAVLFGDNPEIELTGEFLIFKQGRSRIKIPIVSDEKFPLLEPPPENMRPWTEGFLQALRKIRPFISNNAQHYWAMGAYAHEKGLAATNNVVLVDMDFDNPPLSGLLPFWLIDTIERDSPPDTCFDDATKVYLKWKDGTWLRSLRLVDEFPAQPIAMLVQMRARQDPEWEISDEWRQAYKKSLEFAGNEIVVTPDAIIAVGPASEITTKIESRCDGETFWDPRYLGPLLDVATHWDISEYPKPTYFIGDGLRGICVGRIRGRNT